MGSIREDAVSIITEDIAKENALDADSVARAIRAHSDMSITDELAETIADVIVRSHRRGRKGHREYGKERYAGLRFGERTGFQIVFVITRTAGAEIFNVIETQITEKNRGEPLDTLGMSR